MLGGKETLKKLKTYFAQLLAPALVRYIITGCAANGLGLTFFYGLIQQNILPEMASVIAFSLAVTTGYLLNRFWTFDSRVSHKRGIIGYLLSMLACLLLQIALLSFMHRVIAIPAFVAQVIAVGISIPISFVLQKRWVFQANRAD